MVEWLDWDMKSCYGLSWKHAIVPESFSHPAKMSRGQLRRLFRYLLNSGEVAPGGVVLDPFGGIGSTAIEGAQVGLRVVLCELEPKFVALAEKNFDLHRKGWERRGVVPRIVQGDSRRLVEVVGPVLAEMVVSSPPYAGSDLGGGDGQRKMSGAKSVAENKATKNGVGLHGNYGATAGQLGSMPPGEVSAVITSPPYSAGTVHGGNGIDLTKAAKDSHRSADDAATLERTAYSAAPDNLGNQSGETFWSACRTILEQTFLLLRPGGLSCWVVKDFVRKKARQLFCDDWCRLLEACGYVVETRIRCHLIHETRSTDLFGEETVTKKERKSFFRRLYENRFPEMAIDEEQIVLARKPPSLRVRAPEMAGCVVSSPPYACTDRRDPIECNGRQIARRDSHSNNGYGVTDGQLGSLPPGSVINVLPPGDPQ